jgi:hypothetical protein
MTLQKEKKKTKGGNKCDCEGGDAEGGLVAAGTEMERLMWRMQCAWVLASTRMMLWQLRCIHHLHGHFDKWLKINASCPLHKHAVGVSAAAGIAPVVENQAMTAQSQEFAEGAVPA